MSVIELSWTAKKCTNFNLVFNYLQVLIIVARDKAVLWPVSVQRSVAEIGVLYIESSSLKRDNNTLAYRSILF